MSHFSDKLKLKFNFFDKWFVDIVDHPKVHEWRLVSLQSGSFPATTISPTNTATVRLSLADLTFTAHV